MTSTCPYMVEEVWGSKEIHEFESHLKKTQTTCLLQIYAPVMDTRQYVTASFHEQATNY